VHAVILAGGRGRRLQPHTTVFPKPLMPLGDRPILEIVVGQLKRAGFDRLTLAVGHLAGLIEAYFGDGSRFGVRIEYSVETEPLGTAGPLSILKDLREDFLVMNCDVLTDLDFSELLHRHRASGAIGTIAVYHKPVDVALGVVELNAEHNVTGYVEKPVVHYLVSTGIYCFRPDVRLYLEPGARCDLSDLVLRLVSQRERVYGYRFEGRWLDIGRAEDYEVAIEEVARGRVC
jgi:NDP-sugar pyrophosphorylase family protein